MMFMLRGTYEADIASLIVTVHPPVPLHAPDHPANCEPYEGAGVSVTSVPPS